MFRRILNFGLGTAPVYYGRRIFYYGRPQKMFRIILYFWPGNSTSLLWEEDFLLWEASKTFHKDFELFGLGTAPVYYGRRIFYYGRPLGKMFRRILSKTFFWPGNSTSLLWEEDFLLWEASKNVQKDFYIIWGLGTAPVYYGRRIFYYGRPQKLFTITLNYLPGNSTSLLWEEDFLLWEASKNVQKDFIFLAWEQHQFIMGGGFFIMGGLKNFSQSL